MTVVEKASQPSGRGAHITAFGSKIIQGILDEGYITEDQMDYAQIVRNWIRWSQGRLNERHLWKFAHKSGACMDWLQDKLEEQGLHGTLWCDFFKGPDYTEWPVTHFFYDDTTDFVYLNGVSHGLGMDIILPALKTIGEGMGVEYMFDTQALRLVRPGNEGAVTGAIVQNEDGTYTQINAQSVILAAGDYSADTDMMNTYNPWALKAADERLYIPQWVNTGDMHKAALWIGAAMQKNDSHAACMHLESGAQSYNFLHVNGKGERFMNEDVNTQSKSSGKALWGDKRAFTIYDAHGLEKLGKQCEDGLAGGISNGQQYRRFGTPFDFDVENKLLQIKIEEPPFYAGALKATLLSASGGLHCDETCHVLDANDEVIPGLLVCGTNAGDFHGSGDYPTICPGINHGRCLTFGRIAGIEAAGGTDDEIADYNLNMPVGGGIGRSTL